MVDFAKIALYMARIARSSKKMKKAIKLRESTKSHNTFATKDCSVAQAIIDDVYPTFGSETSEEKYVEIMGIGGKYLNEDNHLMNGDFVKMR